MSKESRRKISGALLGLFGLALIGGGGNQIYKQVYGITAQATVTECTKLRRAYVCHGNWTVEAVTHSGEIENADDDDLHQKIEIRVAGGKAIKPGYRVPVVLILLGAFCLWGGMRFALGKVA